MMRHMQVAGSSPLVVLKVKHSKRTPQRLARLNPSAGRLIRPSEQAVTAFPGTVCGIDPSLRTAPVLQVWHGLAVLLLW